MPVRPAAGGVVVAVAVEVAGACGVTHAVAVVAVGVAVQVVVEAVGAVLGATGPCGDVEVKGVVAIRVAAAATAAGQAEAVALANSTVFGLAAGVWTDNLARAHRMVSAIRSGVVHVNTYGGPDITVPLTGHGQCYKLTRSVAFLRGFAYDRDPGDPFASCVGAFMIGANPSDHPLARRSRQPEGA